MIIKTEQMIGKGNTAEVFRLDDNKILKLFRSGIEKQIIEKEYQNGIIIQQILECVPKVYDLVEIDNKYGIIYEEIHGRDMLKIMVGSLWKINAYARKLAHYHLSIQKPITDNLSTYNISTVKKKLEADIKNINLLSDENKEIILKYLDQLPNGNELCHFDFHPGNVMIANNKKYILDWMTACKGDSCADVARTCLMLKYGGVAHAPWVTRKVVSIIQHQIYKKYIREYLAVSHKCMEDVTKWELPVAAARLREWISDDEKKILLQLINEGCDDIKKKE